MNALDPQVARALRRSGLLMLLLAVALPLASRAQLEVASTPPSWSQALKSTAPVPTLRLPAQNNTALIAADAAERQRTGLKRLRYGQPVATPVSPQREGLWTELEGGERLWRLRISSATAKHLGVYFKRFHLPKGAVLYAYTESGQYSGAITGLNNPEGPGGLLLAPLAGEELTLELAIDAGALPEPQLELGHVLHGFVELPMAARSFTSFGASGTCHPDAACLTSQPDAVRAVGVLLADNGVGCSGTLLNNTSGDGRPLFLTADHCDDSFAGREGTYAVVFNYKRACGDFAQPPTRQGLAGARVLSRTRSDNFRSAPIRTDFMLYEILRRPPASFNVYYAGWNRTLSTGTLSGGIWGISHPCGDVMKYAERTSAPTLTSLIDETFTQTPGSNYWRVLWNSNTATEPGSSGSGLFDAQQRLIGQLLGGASFCAGMSPCRQSGTAYVSGPDYYGTIGQSWDGDGTAATRLRDYLDPTGSDALTLGGVNTPNPAPAGYCYSGAESWDDSRIEAVTLNTISSNTSASSCVRYTDLTATQATSLTAGQNYTLNVTKGTCGGNFRYTAKAYIDWNNDKDFNDAGELLGEAVASLGSTTEALNVSIAVPSNVVNGVATVLRVVIRERLSGESDQTALDNTQPCDVYPWGETEDYRINLVNMTTSAEDDASGLNDPSLEVYPNPAQGPVTVNWTAPASDAPALLSITTGTGAAALATTVAYDAATGSYRTTLEAGRLAPGSYVLRVGTRERQASRRLVVVR